MGYIGPLDMENDPFVDDVYVDLPLKAGDFP